MWNTKSIGCEIFLTVRLPIAEFSRSFVPDYHCIAGAVLDRHICPTVELATQQLCTCNSNSVILRQHLISFFFSLKQIGKNDASSPSPFVSNTIIVFVFKMSQILKWLRRAFASAALLCALCIPGMRFVVIIAANNALRSNSESHCCGLPTIMI